VIHDWLTEDVSGRRTTPSWLRAWPLAEFEFRSLFRSTWGVVLFLFCLFPGLARLVMLLIIFGVVNFGPAGLRARLENRSQFATLDPWRVDFYLEPVLAVMPGLVFLLLLSTLVVARTVARDRMANALELYWTRGISPLGYVFGKWLGGFLLLAVVTVAVPVALWVTASLLADDWALMAGSVVGMLRAALGLGLVTWIWTGMCLAISTLCNRPNTAMVAWCMLLVGSSAVGVVLANVLHEPWLRSCLSVWEAGGVVVRAIAGISQRDASIPGAFASLLTTVTLLAAAAWWRLRRTEAIQ
jgi:ABC-type transport system involved in multi-copper enzyme maturation permease subunit